MTVKNDYIIEIADKIKYDIDKCLISGEEVALKNVYRRGTVVYAVTERVFLNRDITSVELLKSDGKVITTRNNVLRTESNEKVKITIPIELKEITKEDDDT